MVDKTRLISLILEAPPEKLRTLEEALDDKRAGSRDDKPLTLLTNSAAAKSLNISRSSWYRIIKDKDIPRVEIRPGTFRIRSSDLNRLVGDCTTTKKPSMKECSNV